MGWNLISPLAQVDLDCSGGVDGVALVGVDGNTEQARVGIDELGLVARPEIVQNRSFIQVGQV